MNVCHSQPEEKEVLEDGRGRRGEEEKEEEERGEEAKEGEREEGMREEEGDMLQGS